MHVDRFSQMQAEFIKLRTLFESSKNISKAIGKTAYNIFQNKDLLQNSLAENPEQDSFYRTLSQFAEKIKEIPFDQTTKKDISVIKTTCENILLNNLARNEEELISWLNEKQKIILVNKQTSADLILKAFEAVQEAMISQGDDKSVIAKLISDMIISAFKISTIEEARSFFQFDVMNRIKLMAHFIDATSTALTTSLLSPQELIMIVPNLHFIISEIKFSKEQEEREFVSSCVSAYKISISTNHCSTLPPIPQSVVFLYVHNDNSVEIDLKSNSELKEIVLFECSNLKKLQLPESINTINAVSCQQLNSISIEGDSKLYSIKVKNCFELSELITKNLNSLEKFNLASGEIETQLLV